MTSIETIAARHGVPTDAAQHVLDALARGQGRMAQFNHPALGGMGQWHAGGMTMIGSMSNTELKARVAALCSDLAPLVADSADYKGLHPGARWPKGFGEASATGTQNDSRYAIFPDTRRLVVETGGQRTIYDTGEHRIHGVSHKQSEGSDLSFSSQLGPVRLNSLRVVPDSDDRSASSHEAGLQAPVPKPDLAVVSPRETGDILATLDRLADLQRRGVVTEAEFEAKKAELLSRL